MYNYRLFSVIHLVSLRKVGNHVLYIFNTARKLQIRRLKLAMKSHLKDLKHQLDKLITFQNQLQCVMSITIAQYSLCDHVHELDACIGWLLGSINILT